VENLKHYLEKERLMSLSQFFGYDCDLSFAGDFYWNNSSFPNDVEILRRSGSNYSFFKDEFGEDKILSFKSNLESDSRVLEVNYISKEQALEIFKEINKDQPVLLESISANILPASLEIKTRKISDLEPLTNELQSKEGVEEVRFYKDVVERFRSTSNAVYIVGFVLVVVFLLYPTQLSYPRLEILLIREDLNWRLWN